MMITRFRGPEVLTIADELSDACGAVFSQPPFNRESDSVEHFHVRLAADVHRPGFQALVATSPPNASRVEGFVTGWITPEPFRTDRAYGKVLDQLGAETVAALLIGALEVDELGVRPDARGGGLARRLLAELTADAPDERAWLLTQTWAAATVAFYEHIGWQPQPARLGTPGDVTVFLSPDHPANVLAGDAHDPQE
jgi:GNAT superfamily N-acetyltransferase